MESSNQHQSVLFSDIVGSSKLYQELGDTKAEEKIRFVMETLASCAQKQGGSVIKTIGDEIMCCFGSLIEATEAAKEMNRFVHDVGVELRTGLSWGAVIKRDNDLFGDVVNSAAFLTKTARAKEILIDEMALDQENSAIVHQIELIAEMTIKGRSEACKIFRLNWEKFENHTQNATLVNAPSSNNKSAQKTLELRHQDSLYTLNQKNPVIVIGRDTNNVALKISHAKISRKHCTLTLKQGKFILEDHSTNGTYVDQEGIEPTFVHRESFALLGSGKLRLGDLNAPTQCQLTYRIGENGTDT